MRQNNKQKFPATKICRKCFKEFEPTQYQISKSDYECPICKRNRQNTANSLRDLSGYSKKRYSRPEVREKTKDYFKSKKTDGSYILIRAARRKVATEIEAGRLSRGPCQDCGSKKSEAHHANYYDPMNIQWLCRRCHMKHHRIDFDTEDAARSAGGKGE